MKIKATCKACDKELLLEQAIASGGQCPWCGVSFQKDYAAVLVDAIAATESAGQTLESALEKMAELRPNFRLDASSLFEGMTADAAKLA